MSHHDHHHTTHGSVFDNKMTLPVLIIALTLALMMVFQMRQILGERKLVKQTYAQQEQPLAQVSQVNKQFESLAVGTARLAGEGNATAQGIIADLRRVGVTVNPNAQGDEPAIQKVTPETAGDAPVPAAAPALVKPDTMKPDATKSGTDQPAAE